MGSPKKRALIVVDVQNYFCPGGSLAVPAGDEVVAPLNRLIDEFLARGEPDFIEPFYYLRFLFLYIYAFILIVFKY